jgi:ribosomal-protein-alanine N-acetyltransferase
MIRRLAPDDLAAVTCLARDDPTMSAGDTSLARSLSDPDVRVFGIDDLESAQALAGHALVARLPFEAELQAILVMPGWRRQGLGVRLLEVRAGNASALALYHRLGFLEDGCRRGYYPHRRPARRGKMPS